MKKKIVMMLLAGALAASTMTGCGKKEESVKPETGVKVEQVKKDENIVVGIDVTADKGWEQTSTPTIVHLESTDGQTDLYHAVKPESGKQEGSSRLVVPNKTYTVSVISPVNVDGSIYTVNEDKKIVLNSKAETKPESATAKKETASTTAKKDTASTTVKKDTVSTDKEPVKQENSTDLKVPMTQIPADQVTSEQLSSIKNEIQEAIKKDDSFLDKTESDKIVEIIDKVIETVKKDEGAKPEENGTADNTVASNSGNSNSGNSNSGKSRTYCFQNTEHVGAKSAGT